jgi:hypothetical protein
MAEKTVVQMVYWMAEQSDALSAALSDENLVAWMDVMSVAWSEQSSVVLLVVLMVEKKVVQMV